MLNPIVRAAVSVCNVREAQQRGNLPEEPLAIASNVQSARYNVCSVELNATSQDLGLRIYFNLKGQIPHIEKTYPILITGLQASGVLTKQVVAAAVHRVDYDDVPAGKGKCIGSVIMGFKRSIENKGCMLICPTDKQLRGTAKEVLRKDASYIRGGIPCALHPIERI